MVGRAIPGACSTPRHEFPCDSATSSAMPGRNPRSHSLKSLLPLLLCLTALTQPATADTYYQFERMWPTLQQPWHFAEPYDVAVDGAGYVFVADTVNHGIQKFTADGIFLTKWGIPGSGAGQFSWPESLAVDGGGNRVHRTIVHIARQVRSPRVTGRSRR